MNVLWLAIAVQLAQDAPVAQPPVTVTQSGTSMIWLAAINVVSLALLAVIARWFDSRKDQANAKATADAAVLAAKIKADEKIQDWARQDAVAAKVSEAALVAAAASKLMVETTALAAKHQDEAAARVNAQLIAIDEQGKKIHILVNSDMTAARTSERDSLRLLVLSLRNAMAQSVKLGLTVRQSEQDEITRVEKRVAELDQILSDRHQAQMLVDAEAKSAALTAEHTAAAAGVLNEIAKNTAATAENTAPDKSR